MKKPQAMMVYPEAWKASPRIAAMHPVARSGYWEILLSMWLAGGELPDDDAMLMACARLTPKDWKAHRAAIRKMLTVSDGMVTQDRLAEEYERTIELVQKRKEAADRRWELERLKKQKQKRSKADPSAMQVHVQNVDFAHETETETVSVSKELDTDTPKPPSGALSPPVPKRQVFGEFGWVQLSEQEVQKLHDRVGIDTAADYVARFDQWVQEAPNAKHSGVKRKDRDAYASILNWIDRDRKEGKHDPRTKRQQISDADDLAILGAVAKRRADRLRPAEVAKDLPDLRPGDESGASRQLLRIVGGSS